MSHFLTNILSIKDPDEFKPERWAEGSPELPKLQEMFIPFSSGKRNCVGQNLATFEIKLVLCTLFRLFEFEIVSPEEKMSWEFFTTLKPANNKVVTVRKRKGPSSS